MTRTRSGCLAIVEDYLIEKLMEMVKCDSRVSFQWREEEEEEEETE